MGINLNQGKNTGRGRKRSAPMAEINVTPFVDVMLVLLIIFMVTAPFLTTGVNVDLPQTSAAALDSQEKPLSVSVKADGRVYLQNTHVKIEELGEKLRAINGIKPDTRIFVRGDKNSNYGTMMQVITAITGAGFAHVAFVTENPQNVPDAPNGE